MKAGKASIKFENPPRIVGTASVVGEKEGDGPLGQLFDIVEKDPMMGKDNWEQAESAMQKKAADLAIEHAGLVRTQIRYLFAGDLLGQLIATSFGTVDLDLPMFGLYGACSTMGEALMLGSVMLDADNADYVMALTSSHFASAEKQFRFPLEYGNQRPFSATWTVTGSGAVILGKKGSNIQITGVTTGRMVDMGVKDSMNMGAAMAPAAADTIEQNLKDFGIAPGHYDRIITGDLGYVGQTALIDLLRSKDINISEQHMDCGIEIFDKEKQDTHAGGSGCGCSAVTLCAYILPKIASGEWKRVLFMPTGALLSSVSFNEGQSIPGIAHAVMIEGVN
ncbi:stage V sporulation protein AD [Lachnotalea sp. AF33-28]|uniref:stage V sporulation protein AD n=1 Tax=Lachnotalea sp. AF33-28 TaxID=2292046 RepID=UPI000E55079C|nr:stage V sporulation protein AD [Lachnotalea sp. AF33-28]RHP32381.1 stage V sporulation protein AD [Lachnotalea sp. AF33-28]